MTSSRDRVALVTGATSGIGRELALLLGTNGWRVLLHGRDRATCERVAAELKGRGAPEPGIFTADLRSLNEVTRMAIELRAAEPELDLLVNNAGTAFRADRAGQREDVPFTVNFLAPYLLMEALLQSLAARRGTILNVASLAQAALARPIRFDGPVHGFRTYGQTKLALIMATRAQAVPYGARGVTLVAAHPGSMVRTAMRTRLLARTPLLLRPIFLLAGRRGPSAADAAAYLAGLLGRPQLRSEGGAFFAKDASPRVHAQAEEAATVHALIAAADAAIARHLSLIEEPSPCPQQLAS